VENLSPGTGTPRGPIRAPEPEGLATNRVVAYRYVCWPMLVTDRRGHREAHEAVNR